jgi:hypothetical protein
MGGLDKMLAVIVARAHPLLLVDEIPFEEARQQQRSRDTKGKQRSPKGSRRKRTYAASRGVKISPMTLWVSNKAP